MFTQRITRIHDYASNEEQRVDVHKVLRKATLPAHTMTNMKHGTEQVRTPSKEYPQLVTVSRDDLVHILCSSTI